MLTSRSDASCGLGQALSGTGSEQRFGHGGAHDGFRCEPVAYTHRGQGAVVMTNGDNGSRLAGEIIRGIAAEYGWPGILRPEVDVVDLAPQLLGEYVGTHRLEDGTAVTGMGEGEALYGQAAGAPRSRLRPTSGSTFVLDDSGAAVNMNLGHESGPLR